MYTKEKTLSLSTTLSPFPKNLSLKNGTEQKITLSFAHKNCFNYVVINNRFECETNGTEFATGDNKDANYDKDYIIQFYSEENELLLSYENDSEMDSNQNNIYGRGVTRLSPSVICVGTNRGAILNFQINDQKHISDEKELMETQHVRPITDLVSDGEERLISSDDCGKICVWDYNHSTKALNKRMIFDGFDESSCNSLALHKNWLYGGYGSGHLRIFDLTIGTMVCEISAHSKWITGLDIASKAGYLLSISEDSFVRVWELLEENDSIKVNHRFSESIANHMLFGGVFLDSLGNTFCVGGYDSKELHCFKSRVD